MGIDSVNWDIERIEAIPAIPAIPVIPVIPATPAMQDIHPYHQEHKIFPLKRRRDAQKITGDSRRQTRINQSF